MVDNRITYTIIGSVPGYPNRKLRYRVIGWTIRDNEKVLLCEDGTTLEVALDQIEEMTSDKDFLQFNYKEYMESICPYGSKKKNVKK